MDTLDNSNTENRNGDTTEKREAERRDDERRTNGDRRRDLENTKWSGAERRTAEDSRGKERRGHDRRRRHSHRRWRHFKKTIPFYDHIFAYRWKNIDDYHKIGYHNTSLLRSYYLKDKNYHLSTPHPAYACDVIFIGHFEDDGRDLAIKTLLEAGVNLKLFGTGWEKSRLYDFFVQKFGSIKPLYHDEYNKALNSAKIALVFLSKLNNDTYTRRCFEIPATQTMMMAEYTADLATLFEEGKEADFFRNHDELLQKIKKYLNDEELLKQIGISGFTRLLAEGHEVTDRAAEVVKEYDRMKGLS